MKEQIEETVNHLRVNLSRFKKKLAKLLHKKRQAVSILSPEQENAATKTGEAMHTEIGLVLKSIMQNEKVNPLAQLMGKAGGGDLALRTGRKDQTPNFKKDDVDNIDELIDEEFKIAEEEAAGIKGTVANGTRQVKFGGEGKETDETRYADTASKMKSPDGKEDLGNHEGMPQVTETERPMVNVEE